MNPHEKKQGEKKTDFLGTAIPRKRLPPPSVPAPSLDAPIPRRPSSNLDAPIPRRTSTNLDAPIPRRPSINLDAPIPRRPPSNLDAPIPRRSAGGEPSSRSIKPDYPPPKHKLKKHKILRRAMSASTSSSLQQTPASQQHQREQRPTAHDRWIRLKSEDPLILRIKTSGMSRTQGIPRSSSTSTIDTNRPAATVSRKIPKLAAASKLRRKKSTSPAPPVPSRGPARAAATKRPRSAYLEDTDSEDEAFLMPPLKKTVVTTTQPDGTTVTTTTTTQAGTALLTGNIPGVDTPPPGTLSTLWYSNEQFLHMFVVEKLLGWKMRPKVALPAEPLAKPLAVQLQSRALQSDRIWKHAGKRMEISRINPTHCPVVLTLAGHTALATENEVDSSNDGENNNTSNAGTNKKEPMLEEVLLVKWRGRSYWHCSWERASDLARLDISNNSQARGKMKRFYQHQETVYGTTQWKAILREEHNAVRVPGAPVVRDDLEAFFSPQCLEVERIMGCDESELNEQVLIKQRRLNLVGEEALSDSTNTGATHISDSSAPASPEMNESKTLYQCIVEGIDIAALHAQDWPWDCEDNVRYVVKWKGLPYAEMTWEYWRDIKRDAVEETQAFWRRQKVPELPPVSPTPSLANFRKLQTSPRYGVRMSEMEKMQIDGEDDEEGFRLRGYQLEGVNWLLFNWYNGRSCILADEMGLGKTIQSAAFMRELQVQKGSQVRGPFLIVAPLSLVGQWQSELLAWAPDMNVVLYHGSADAREFLVEHEFYFSDQFVPKLTAVKLKKQHVTKFHVLITTFEVVLKDAPVFSKIHWKTLIVDEAHRLKNHKSRLFEQLANVPRDYCVLLTGTPIANATEELWALLHFANPTIFRDKDEFLEKFGQMTGAEQVNQLHTLLKPYLLRRVKEDVEKSLPPKEETILEVTLTPVQKTFYKAIYERNTSFLYKGSKPSNAPSLMNVMMELRKCCNHAFLVKGAEDRILNDAAAKLKLAEGEQVNYLQIFGEQLIKSSGKMVLMEKLLQKLFTGGHKVLIFSQMVRVLDLLEEMMKLKKYLYERLDGSTSSSSRVHAVERFNRKSLKRFVMLLSTRAGGLGLNLTAADTVIIFDSDWNPQNDLQAMARAHRIGQTRAVRVYRLLTAKTYEMHMFHSASLKLGLERAVLSQNRDQIEESDSDGKSKKRSDKEAQAKEIDELLKKGAYDVFRDEDDTEAEKFMETDIDQLLENSAKKVTYGASATSSLNSGLGSFNKASFVADTDDGAKDVDLDDPDFWSKAVGLEAPEETSEDIAQMIDDGVKRSRKQVQQYDPYAETAESERLKKERLELEKMLEKEEKERIQLEKKKKKKEAKEKKKREREELKSQQQATKKEATGVARVASGEPIKTAKEEKEPKPSKKSKKSERQRALRRAENADPILERLKQAWEVSQRHRATAAAIRFGFARFCKLRNESNLTGLPLQDLEVFVRAYTFQLGLQVAVALLSRANRGDEVDLRALFREWLGARSQAELDWICDAVQNAMGLQLDVENYIRELRMPLILAEPSFVTELRHGAALRALRRLCILARLNRFIDNCLNSTLSVLGHEALGKRGCAGDLSALDADLKARFVTTEELSLAIGSFYRPLRLNPPALWWDRSCDVGLIIGSFVHGLGNYESMRNDSDLPFADKILKLAHRDKACAAATHTFGVATRAARQVFDDALESARVKAELEVQAAVAAAAKAAAKREEDAAVLRKGGVEAEAVISSMPDTQVDDAFAFDGTDSHFVTLPRLQNLIQTSVRKDAEAATQSVQPDRTGSLPKVDKNESISLDEDGGSAVRDHEILPMPDARVLDHRLLSILDEIEKVAYPDENPSDAEPNEETDLWYKSSDVETSLKTRRRAFTVFATNFKDTESEYSGIGLGSNQCGTSHKSLNDGSDFGFGSGSAELAHVAYGTDAPRYLRALGVPMNITRFAVAGLVHADSECVKELLISDSLRYYGKEDATGDALAADNEKTALDSTGATLRSQNGGGLSTDSEKKGGVANGVDPNVRMPEAFRQNAALRASVCLAVLFYGFPPSNTGSPLTVDPVFWARIHEEASIHTSDAPAELFNTAKFRQLIVDFMPDGCAIPDISCISVYIEKFLLPLCLRLCVNGNGATTRNARGSHGAYATAFGVSVHAEPSQPHPSPLPDPCLGLQDHSLEALGHALAILRRVRLLRACMYICGGKDDSTVETVFDVAKSEFMGSLESMPIWWCPWIHDVALLVQAATGGLFSVISQPRADHAIFAPRVLQDHLYSSFIASDVSPTRRSSPEAIREWTEGQSQVFPSLCQLERRLAFLCGQVTRKADAHVRFDCLPMFDHGGWPRN